MFDSALGSIWRKWDLHVHTPESHLCNEFGVDFLAYFKALLQRIADTETAVIGITDYFTIEGYKKIRDFLADDSNLNSLVGEELAGVARSTLFLPNIEFRLDVLVNNQRVNLHVLFSPDVLVQDIQEHFLEELSFINHSTPSGADDIRKLKIANLEDLGRRLKEENEPFRSNSDIFVGMMNAAVIHADITSVLERQGQRFKGKYLIAVPSDEDLSDVSWNGQGHQTRKLLIQKSSFLFATNTKTIAWALGKKHKSPFEFVAEFGSIKPCFSASDAHSAEKLLNPPNGKACWIKADPTFAGLKQAILEPEHRVFIGDLPDSLKRVRQHATKYLSRIEIRQNDNSSLHEKWFASELPLNYELIAVIGNKGSGKSALADSIGLLGNSNHQEDFSFLQREKFKQLRNNKAEHFWIEGKWASGSTIGPCSLDAKVDDAAVETVKYIPQRYLEKICNSIGDNAEGAFLDELKSVIFSHVSEADRLGQTSIDNLISYRTTEIETAIDQHREKLDAVNKAIAGLMASLSEKSKKSLQGHIDSKQADLTAHIAAKPEAVSEPTEAGSPQDLSLQEAIRTNADELVKLMNEKAEKETQQRGVAGKVARLEKLKIKLANFRRDWETLMSESVSLLEGTDLELGIFVELHLNDDKLLSIMDTLISQKREIEKALNSEVDNTLAYRIKKLVAENSSLEEKLGEPQRKRQAYLEALKRWEEAKVRLEGDEVTPDTLAFLIHQRDSLPEREQELNRLRDDRLKIVREICALIRSISDVYREMYAPVQTSVTRHELSGILNISFDIAYSVTSFESDFFDFITHKAGSFRGVKDGEILLGSTIEEAAFSNDDGVIAFLNRIDGLLSLASLESQLKERKDPVAFWNMLYGLDYLRPTYCLRWNDSDIRQLSPGERGTLLLAFYLIIDNDEKPLVIDQPEDNLDNQTVYDVLVPAINHAKKRRQIIIVTHNPNLAVVCDANQVIYASHEPGRVPILRYESGSLESPDTRNHVVDVLEGTMPAFDKRDAKYDVVGV